MSQDQEILGVVKQAHTTRGGTVTHIIQRATAIVLVPLFIWFVIQVIALLHGKYTQLEKFWSSPVQITMFVLLCFFSLLHGMIGMQAVFRDYIKCLFIRYSALMVLYLILLSSIFASLYIVIRCMLVL